MLALRRTVTYILVISTAVMAISTVLVTMRAMHTPNVVLTHSSISPQQQRLLVGAHHRRLTSHDEKKSSLLNQRNPNEIEINFLGNIYGFTNNDDQGWVLIGRRMRTDGSRVASRLSRYLDLPASGSHTFGYARYARTDRPNRFWVDRICGKLNVPYTKSGERMTIDPDKAELSLHRQQLVQNAMADQATARESCYAGPSSEFFPVDQTSITTRTCVAHDAKATVFKPCSHADNFREIRAMIMKVVHDDLPAQLKRKEFGITQVDVKSPTPPPSRPLRNAV